jgi:hypothetical protein
MLGAGVLLFVSAHWDALSPGIRFFLVLTLVGLFHAAAAFAGARYQPLSAALHGVGTVSLGAGIFLAGQIFNMAAHWPSGILLWAIGAWCAWLVLRHGTQLFFAALLTPAWYVSEWLLALERAGRRSWDSEPITGCAIALLALTYFTLPREAHERRGVVVWLGGVLLPPALLLLAIVSASRIRMPVVPTTTLVVAWTIALGVPLCLATYVRRAAAWINGVAIGWLLLLLWLSTFRWTLLIEAWWALGALGLVGWGVREGRTERINVGAFTFGVTVIVFYFSNVMDKLGRSASLIAFGLLFLAGGWALEHGRRRLVRAAREDRQ